MTGMINNQDSDFNPNVPTLKQVRDRLGMTQEQFAEAIGISRRTVIYYENRQRQRLALSMSQIKRLMELMEQAGFNIKDLPDDLE